MTPVSPIVRLCVQWRGYQEILRYSFSHYWCLYYYNYLLNTDSCFPCCRIVYDEEAIRRLLDRSQEGEEERQEAMAEYLESFKVATYSVKQGKEVWSLS